MVSNSILCICSLVLVLSVVVLDYSAAFIGGEGVWEHFLYISDSPGAVFPRILIAWS